MVEIKEEFSVRLNKALDMRDIKAVDLCEKTGISESAMSQYRNGRNKPKQPRIVKIANALRVNPAWLMGLDVPMNANEYFHESPLIRALEKSKDDESAIILERKEREMFADLYLSQDVIEVIEAYYGLSFAEKNIVRRSLGLPPIGDEGGDEQ